MDKLKAGETLDKKQPAGKAVGMTSYFKNLEYFKENRIPILDYKWTLEEAWNQSALLNFAPEK